MLVVMPNEKPSDGMSANGAGIGAVRGIVHSEVEPTKLVDTAPDHGTYGILVGHVGRYCQHATAGVAELNCGLLQPFLAPGGDRYGRAGADKCRRDSGTDALAATGDQRHPICEVILKSHVSRLTRGGPTDRQVSGAIGSTSCDVVTLRRTQQFGRRLVRLGLRDLTDCLRRTAAHGVTRASSSIGRAADF
jgi:hypothetical protein